jgi:hypothetical protein
MLLPIAAWFSATASTWSFEGDALGGTPTNGRLIGDSVSGMSPLFLTVSLNPGMFDGATPLSGPVSALVNVVFRAASAVTGGLGRLVLNGGAVTSGSQTNAAFSGFNLGSNNGTFDHHNGHLRFIRYWGRALSDTELQQVTS